MTSDQPTPIPVPARSRRRPAHVWTFERLETRALLSTSPIVATARELASARPIGSGVATGSVAPGSRAFYRLDLLTDQRLVATLHAPGASARLTLLDGQGRELTRSEGRSATDRDARIAQHLGPGTAYFEVEGLTGAGPFRLTADREAASIPDQSIPLDPFADTGPLASGDFNGDGRLDLASGITVDDGFEFFGGISMLLGVGDRTFAPPVTYPLNSSNVAALAVGDFNKDGRLDLAAGVEAEDEFSSGLEIVVLLGAGDGTFGRPDVVFFAEIDYFTGVEFSLAVGDFDGDGRADLATGIGFAGFSGSGGGVVVLLGSGDGTFAPPDYYLLGNIVASLEAGDFDGDGRPDLVAGIGIYFPTPGLPFLSFGSFGAVSVLLGIGDGTFAPTVDYAVDFSVVSVAVGDFDGDGRPDLAAGNGTVGASNSRPGIVVLKGIGDGAFTSPESYLVGSLALDLAVGDFDGDGRADLAVGNQLGGGIAVLLGAGNGSFGPPATSLTGSRISGYSIRDYDGDGRPDLAANIGTNDRTGTFGEVKVLRGAGDGTFGPPAISPADVFNSISSMVASDFSGDGRLDLVVGTRPKITSRSYWAAATAPSASPTPSSSAAPSSPWWRATSTATAGPTSPSGGSSNNPPSSQLASPAGS